MRNQQVSDVVHHAQPRRSQIDGLKAVIASKRRKAQTHGRGEVVTEIFTSVMTMVFVTAVWLVGIYVAEWIYHPLYYVVGAAFSLLFAFRLAAGLNSAAVDRDDAVISSGMTMSTPLIELVGKGDPAVKNYLSIAQHRPLDQEIAFRSTLAQLSMIDMERDAALDAEMSRADREQIDEATRKATMRVLNGLMNGSTAILPAQAAPLDIGEFSSRIERIAAGDVIVPTGRRTGHVETDRLIALAESILSEEPDLCDASGAAVAPLVREHLPRLVDKHRRAIAHASAEDRAQADETLRRGVAKASASIYEAMASFQKRRGDELSTQARFLDMRHGGEL